MVFVYAVLGLAILQGILSLIEGFRAARHFRTYRPGLKGRPHVTVFCACKGTDPGFEENVRSILDQDYPARDVVFIVESGLDPAFDALKSLGASTVLVAGEASVRGQKVHNLIYGVEHAGERAGVYVFCDVDARFPRDWVSNLIAPLGDDAVGVSTGYRWYAAESGSLPGLLRSIWNASAVTLLGAHGRNFVWGGSMALRRDVFDRIGVRQAWSHAVSDDYAVTRAARSAGMRIVFVPRCLVPSYGDCSWAELLEFTTRQIVITRVYEPRLWRMALLSQSLFNAAFWGGLFVFWPASLGLYFLAGIKSYVRYNAVRKVLPPGALSKHRWSYILFLPLTAVLYQYNLIRSACTRNIRWRRIRYTLIAPDHTVVRRGAGEN
jgi:cellulose synthase/poly-beta-1,6-N-acetylglucosamine synthase-like glycosyltransferase